MLTKYGLVSVLRIKETPTCFPLPLDAELFDEPELLFDEPQAASAAERQTTAPTAAARVRRLRRPDAAATLLLIGMSM
jgi:hypothetical protein